jgi:hypothetical protein
VIWRLILSLAILVPVWTVIGVFTTLDSHAQLWLGCTIGALVGVFFGLVFGGNPKWRVWNWIFGPEDTGRPR